MNQIGFGKYGTSGGDQRKISPVAVCQITEFLNIFKVETFRLLIKEISCSCSTRSIGPVIKILTPVIESSQSEFFSPDDQ